MYRNAGLSLKAIKIILDTPDTDFTTMLSSRFEELNHEMSKLQEQQRIIAGLLQNTPLLQPEKMTKELWTSILRASGLSELEMRNWHITFEKESPEQHRAFLQYLQIPDAEIEIIKSWAADPPVQPESLEKNNL